MAKRCFYSIIILACILGWGRPSDSYPKTLFDFLKESTEQTVSKALPSKQAEVFAKGQIEDIYTHMIVQ